jgi:hypothetical protein
MIELGQDIIKINILTKFEEDGFNIVTYRVLTKFLKEDGQRTTHAGCQTTKGQKSSP